MCGIVGFYGQGDKQILEKMAKSLDYRGPDDEGFFIDNTVGLGHQRLTIIDLSSSGRQPMANEDGKIQLVFNGEIYNYKELKKDLTKKGHSFKSQTDSEVVVHQYEEDGLKCFSKLNGMFALAIWDSREKKLILSRDRYGQKPLYWTENKNSLIFSSELKALFFHPLVKKEIDPLACFQYFSFDYVPQPRTIFKNINKLENGQILVFHQEKVELEKYYQFNLEESDTNFNSALNEFEKIIADSVKKRLIADVPVGVFLSGGIDSSTVAYFAKKQKKEIETFSIGFSQKSFDESYYALKAANFLKTKHYHYKFQPDDLIKVIPEIIDKLDEPFGDSSILPTYLLSGFTCKKVKVALAGDGGDELLMGYPNHQVQKIISLFRLDKFKTNINIAEVLENILPVSSKNLTLFYKAKRYSHSLAFNGLWRDFLSIGGYLNNIDGLFNFKIDKSELFNFSNNFLEDFQDASYLKKINLLLLKYYLTDNILFKADRASMYHGLEVRAPFLDYRLADFSNSLPLHWKLKGLKSKYILKCLMKDKLPKEIVYRKKKGFGVPLTLWFRKELKNFLIDNLSKKEINKFGLINYQETKKLINQHLKKERDNRKVLWNLIIFQNWLKRYYV